MDKEILRTTNGVFHFHFLFSKSTEDQLKKNTKQKQKSKVLIPHSYTTFPLYFNIPLSLSIFLSFLSHSILSSFCTFSFHFLVYTFCFTSLLSLHFFILLSIDFLPPLFHSTFLSTSLLYLLSSLSSLYFYPTSHSTFSVQFLSTSSPLSHSIFSLLFLFFFKPLLTRLSLSTLSLYLLIQLSHSTYHSIFSLFSHPTFSVFSFAIFSLYFLAALLYFFLSSLSPSNFSFSSSFLHFLPQCFSPFFTKCFLPPHFCSILSLIIFSLFSL